MFFWTYVYEETWRKDDDNLAMTKTERKTSTKLANKILFNIYPPSEAGVCRGSVKPVYATYI